MSGYVASREKTARTDEPPLVRVGIDENGLGPRLGPLIVTAVTARASGEGHRISRHKPRGAITKRLGDSKGLVSYGDSALGEAWARALARRTGRGRAASDPDELVHAMSLDEQPELRRACPEAHLQQCWNTNGERFAADESLVGAIIADLDRLAARGLDVLDVRVAIVCTERLNANVKRGLSRFVSDLHAMERLALAARADAGEEIAVTCGKVGGYDRYTDAFGPLAGRLSTTLSEGRAVSEYRIAGLGRISFVRDADEGHTLVCIASLVGKWVRDLLMMRVTRYHRAHDPSLPEASGYHDPVTARFVAMSALARKQRGVADNCFERTSLPSEPG
jgi:ribonuclease HII